MRVTQITHKKDFLFIQTQKKKSHTLLKKKHTHYNEHKLTHTQIHRQTQNTH